MSRQSLCVLTAIIVLSAAWFPFPMKGQTGDIRLSHKTLEYILPDSAKIESASRIGENTLVAWGSTRGIGDSAIVPILVVQAMYGAQRNGMPRILTSANARPSGFVQVIALAKRFMVVWSDTRGGDTVAFSQLVDTAGSAIGTERVFVSVPIDLFGITRLLTATGFRLVWNKAGKSSSRIFWIDLDRDGNNVGIVSGPLWGSVQEVLNPELVPGTTILNRGSHQPLLFTPAGTFDSLRGEAARHFSLPYFLQSDGEMITLDAGRIRYYRTFLDSIAYMSKRVPDVPNLDVGSMSLSEDSIGRPELIWATGGFGRFGGCYSNGGPEIIYLQLYSAILTNADTLTVPENVGQAYGAYLNDREMFDITLISVRQIRGCNNQYFVQLIDTVDGFKYTSCSSTPVHFSSYGSAEFYVHGNGTANGNYPAGSEPSFECSRSSDILVIREPGDSVSSILLFVGNQVVRLGDTSAQQYIYLPNGLPTVAHNGNELIVSWLKMGKDTSARVGRLSSPDMSITEGAGLSFGTPGPGLDTRTGLSSISDVLQHAGWPLIERRERWNGTLSNGAVVDSQKVIFFKGNQFGWDRVDSVEASDVGRTLKCVDVDMDPDQGNVLLETCLINPNYVESRLSVVALDHTGTEQWRVDSLPLSPINGYNDHLHLVPLSGKRFLGLYYASPYAFDSSSLLWYRDTGPVEKQYAKLFGASILGMFVGYDGSWVIGVELYNTAASSLGHGIAFPIVRDEPLGVSLVLNDRDSSIFFFCGSSAGVRMFAFDSQLKLRAADKQISITAGRVTNPIGVIRDDTLYLVWEDYRNGMTDIYGRLVPLNRILDGVPETNPVAGEEVLIAPNPANEFAVVRATVSGRAIAQIVDCSGVIRRQWEYSISRPNVDLQSLAIGVYRLVIKDATRIRSAPLIVVR